MSKNPDGRPGSGTNQEGVRRHNLGTLLRHVHRVRQISRAELTSLMALNRSTIAGLVAELESLGATEQADPSPVRHGAGRPSTEVRITTTGPYVMAVDVAVGRLMVARVGLGGVVQGRATAPLPGKPDPEQVARTVVRLVSELVAGAPRGAPLVAMGISLPGVIRRADGVVRSAPNLGWHDVPFGDMITGRLGPELPVSLGNDGNLGALAEHLRGAGVGVDNLVYLSGLVGVGAGLIMGGVPLEGAGGYAGEIGHMLYRADGRVCHCGSQGCWETEVGAEAIAKAIGCPPDAVTSLSEFLDELDGPTPELREIGRHVGLGLASAVNLLNPQVILMGGYVRSLYALVHADVLEALRSRAMQASGESVTLEVPGLGEDSVLLGAAEMAFAPLFEDPVTALSGSRIALPADLAHPAS